ncbi:MAG: reverse transcriptase domain-containing protein, partial [Candidatus Thiodiazotropha endolucinida]|nr:hypothetical protein [Candidatus Thiodiazotropha taylori]MCW4347026.1 reverse transcriptase domain-containing protein [Candidatus Thiodiazotropha endolucinida]
MADSTANPTPNPTPNPTRFEVLQWNARGVSHLPELRAFLDDKKIKPHIICLQETHLKIKDKTPHIPTYKLASLSSRTKRAGGVATYIKDNIPYEKLDLKIKDPAIETCAITLHVKGNKIAIINCYDPPNNLNRENELRKIFDSIPHQNYILVGDLNAHDTLWGPRQNPRGRTLVEIIQEKGAAVLNDGAPTMADFTTTPDITIATPNLAARAEWYTLDNSCGSDHLPILSKYNSKFDTTGAARKEKWNLNKADWELFKQLCSQKLKFNKNLSTEELANQFTDTLQEICDRTIPKSAPKDKKLLPPWWNQECRKAINAREQARKKYLKNRTSELKAKYNELKAQARITLENAKKESWQGLINKINSKTTSKEMWSILNKFRGKPAENINCLKIDNQIITNDLEKANALANHYNKMSKTANQDPAFQQTKPTNERNIQKSLPDVFKEDRSSSNLNCDFSLFELNEALMSKHNTSPGADQIHYEMLKQLPPDGKQELLELINISWRRGEVPTQWKLATIIPIPKPNKDKLDPQSYRPISLTSCTCKIMETMIGKRLTGHIEKNNLISDNQSGFRPNRSTTDQLVRLESEINKAFMEHRSLVAVALDLEKAFDLMWSTGTIAKLKEKGINGNMLQWIHNFLIDRKIQTRVGDKTSEQKTLENGCPQGSVLSPMLFNIIVNTLDEALKLKKDIGLSQFADDSAVWATRTTLQKAVTDIQAVLNEIERWAQKWGFKVSNVKTKAIVFSKRRLNIADHSLRLFGKKLEWAKTIKFLGMTFDRLLTWKPHITELRNRCKNDLNLMRIVSGTAYGADKKALINLYKALILSKLDYGAQAYNSASENILKPLDTIQNHALRIATKALQSTPINALEVECGIKPLYLRREELTLKYWARSFPLGSSLPINDLITDQKPRLSKRAKMYNPYCTNVRALVVEHGIPRKIQPPSYRSKWDLKHEPPSCELKELLGKKGENSKDYMKNTSLNYINAKHAGKTHIYTDGSKDPELGKTGKTGAAFVVPEWDKHVPIRTDPNLSVFTTELIAIQYATKWAIEMKITNAVILTDSLSSIQALQSGKSNSRPDKIDIILTNLDKAKRNGQTIEIEWIPSHVGIPGNEAADQIAKLALYWGPKEGTLPSKREIYTVIETAIIKKWQEAWDKNPSNTGKHYKILQPTVSKHAQQHSSDRKLDVVLSRLRFNHT